MMKTIIQKEKLIVRLSPMTAECIALAYQHMSAGRTYARDLISDANVPLSIKKDMIAVAADLTITMGRIDRRIPEVKWEDFNTQVKQADALCMDNIKALYVRMSEEQRMELEDYAEKLYRKK